MWTDMCVRDRLTVSAFTSAMFWNFLPNFKTECSHGPWHDETEHRLYEVLRLGLNNKHYCYFCYCVSDLITRLTDNWFMSNLLKSPATISWDPKKGKMEQHNSLKQVKSLIISYKLTVLVFLLVDYGTWNQPRLSTRRVKTSRPYSLLSISVCGYRSNWPKSNFLWPRINFL